LFIFLNSSDVCLPFRPPCRVDRKLYRLVDTTLQTGEDVSIDGFLLQGKRSGAFEYLVSPRSVVVLAEKGDGR
jgi:hypothetical protein